MKRCFITGATGFIGGHLAETLMARGVEVRCLVRKTADTEFLKSLGVQLVVGDVKDIESFRPALSDVDVVFHLAGITAALSLPELMRVNRDGTEQVARACASCEHPPVLLLVSSVAAAGPVPRGVVRDESLAPAPISNYGRSKRAGELAVIQFADRVPTTIVRPGIVFGPRNRETLPIFRTIAWLRMHPVVGLRSPPLSLIHVADLVEFLIQAALRGKRLAPDHDPQQTGQGYYFACVPEYPDYGQWGDMIKSALDRSRAPTLPLVGPMPWLAAGVKEFIARVRRRPDSFNIDKIREASAPSWACSVEAARRDLDFHPARTLEQRTRETASWYRENGWV